MPFVSVAVGDVSCQGAVAARGGGGVVSCLGAGGGAGRVQLVRDVG